MRYLILSDIHGNLHALDAVLADAGARWATTRRSAWATWSATAPIRAASSIGSLALEPVAMIRGNHDKVCAGLEPPVLFNEVARQSIEWTATTITPAQLEALARAAEGPARRGAAGSRSATARRSTRTTTSSNRATPARAMDAATERLCLFGHTHLPALFATAEDPIRADDPGSRAICTCPTPGRR